MKTIKRTFGALIIMITVYMMIRAPQYFNDSRAQLILIEAVLLAVVFIAYNVAFAKKNPPIPRVSELSLDERTYFEWIERVIIRVNALERLALPDHLIMAQLFSMTAENLNVLRALRFKISQYIVNEIYRVGDEFETALTYPKENIKEYYEAMEKTQLILFMINQLLSIIVRELLSGKKIDSGRMVDVLQDKIDEVENKYSSSQTPRAE